MSREVIDNSFDPFQKEIELKRRAALEGVKRVPIAALIWGPSPEANSLVAETRVLLKETLIEMGHLAHFSEELFDENSQHSNLIQQATQVEAYDIVFSIPDSPGSIAEIHDFARLPQFSSKVITFLNSQWNDGYSNKSLLELQTYSSCKVQLYEQINLPECIVNSAVNLLCRLQELFYLNGRRPR